MLNPMDLNGRKILLTGASSGIGRETAVLLSELGAKVILVGRRQDQLVRTSQMLNGNGHRLEMFDLLAVEDIPLWIKNIAKEVGPLHGLVHSAGIQVTRPLRILTSETVDEVMRINVTAAIALTKGFRQKGVRAHPASIVFLASVVGIVGQSGNVAYTASKGAVIAVTRSLALELAKENIRVNCIAPAHVRTEMTAKAEGILTSEQVRAIEAVHPLGIGKPRDVANAIAFLLADTGRWITGTTMVVDGGLTAH